MNKIQSALLVVGLMFFLALTAVGCAHTGADTMGTTDTMETGMKNMSDDTMDKGMDKPMDTMNTDTMIDNMDKGMEKNMQDTMK